MQFKISIITVSYNSISTIRDTFNSVLNQTYSNIEYIVVDGKSTDRTVEIIKEYEPLFNGRMVWLSEHDNGLYDAMNKGIKMATGNIVGIINSDDIYSDKNSIQHVMDVFNSIEDIDCVYSNLDFVSQHNTAKTVRHWNIGNRKHFSQGWNPAHPTFFLKKKIYDQYGTFDTQFKLAADFEIMLRFIERYKIKSYYLQKTLVKMRIGGASTKGIKNLLVQNIECLNSFKKNNIKVKKATYLFKRLVPKVLQITIYRLKC